MNSEALRSVFAELGFDVDLDALDAADKAVSEFAAKVETVAAEVARTITIGGVEYDAGSWQAHVEGVAAQQAQASAQAEEDARKAAEDRIAAYRGRLAEQSAKQTTKVFDAANKKSWAEAAKRDEAQRKRAGSILGRLGIDFDSDALDKGTKRVDDFVVDIKKRMAAAFGQKVFAGLARIIPGASGLAQRLGFGAGEFAAFGQLVSRVALGIVGAFALATAAAFTFASGYAQATEQLRDTATTLRITSGALQEFRYIAEQSGLGTQRMEAALTALHGRLENIELHRGGGATLRRLGVAARDASGAIRPATDVMLDLGAALNRVDNPIRRARIEQQLFGADGRRVGETLREQVGNVDEYRAHMAELGGGTLPEAVEASRAFTRAQGDFRLATESVRSVLFTALAPTLTWLTEKVALAAGWFSRMTRNTHVVQIALVALGAGGVAALAPLVASMIAAAAVPLLIVAAVALLGIAVDDLITFMEGGDSAIGRFLDSFLGAGEAVRIARNLREVWGDIVDFLDRNAARIERIMNPTGSLVRWAIDRVRGGAPVAAGAQTGPTAALPAAVTESGGTGGGREVRVRVSGGAPQTVSHRTENHIQIHGAGHDNQQLADMVIRRLDERERRQRDATHPTAEDEG